MYLRKKHECKHTSVRLSMSMHTYIYICTYICTDEYAHRERGRERKKTKMYIYIHICIQTHSQQGWSFQVASAHWDSFINPLELQASVKKASHEQPDSPSKVLTSPRLDQNALEQNFQAHQNSPGYWVQARLKVGALLFPAPQNGHVHIWVRVLGSSCR